MSSGGLYCAAAASMSGPYQVDSSCWAISAVSLALASSSSLALPRNESESARSLPSPANCEEPIHPPLLLAEDRRPHFVFAASKQLLEGQVELQRPVLGVRLEPAYRVEARRVYLRSRCLQGRLVLLAAGHRYLSAEPLRCVAGHPGKELRIGGRFGVFCQG